MAERQGFEPWVPVKGQRFSRPPRSTTPAPLRGGLGAGAFKGESKWTQESFSTSFEKPIFSLSGRKFLLNFIYETAFETDL